MRFRSRLWRVYYVLMVMGGIGMLVYVYSQSAAAEAYRQARQCGSAVANSCYQLFPGVIQSVSVTHARSGERDKTVISTNAHGEFTVELLPAFEAAPHIKSGADVTLKRYQGRVTLVEVDGYFVPSSDNPAALQDELAWLGVLAIVIGLLGTFSGKLSRLLGRIALRITPTRTAAPERPELASLPSGDAGWVARPRGWTGVAWRYAIASGATVLLTLPALYDASRRPFALLLDTLVVAGLCISAVLFFRNARLVVSPGEVAMFDLFGRISAFTRSSIAYADRFTVSGRYAQVPYLVLVGTDGQPKVHLSGTTWDYEQLDQLLSSAAIPLRGAYQDPVPVGAVSRRAPGISRRRSSLAGAAMVIILILAFVLLMMGPLQR